MAQAKSAGSGATLKMRLLSPRVVQAASGCYPQKAGQIVEMGRDEAQRHIDAGLAELVELETVHS